MREIKFRAFHKYRKEMEYFSNLYWFEENGIQEYDDSCEWIIEQFTGLQDCKGNDIYEGDILSFDRECNYSVVFKDGSFRKSYKGWDDSIIKPVINKNELSILSDHVIGNIHEGIK